MGRMFPRDQREAGRCVGAFGGSRDPLWGIGVVRGLEGHTFREIGGPVRIQGIVPEPDDGVVAEYRIEFVLAHLTRDEAGVVDGRCGGLRRIGQTGNGRVRGFPDFSHSAAAWRLPGLAAASPVLRLFPGTETSAALDEWRLAGDGKAGFVAVR